MKTGKRKKEIQKIELEEKENENKKFRLDHILCNFQSQEVEKRTEIEKNNCAFFLKKNTKDSEKEHRKKEQK